MKLGTGENLVKQYDYYHTSNGNKGSITVTNRRIVATRIDKCGESREEIRVRDVKSIDSGYHRVKKYDFNWLFLSLIGIVLFILGVKEEEVNTLLAILGGLCFIGGFILLFVTAKLAQNFYISIHTDMAEGRAIHSAVSTMAILNESQKKKVIMTKKKVTIYIEESVAVSLMDEIGGIILELQA